MEVMEIITETATSMATTVINELWGLVLLGTLSLWEVALGLGGALIIQEAIRDKRDRRK